MEIDKFVQKGDFIYEICYKKCYSYMDACILCYIDNNTNNICYKKIL